MNVRDHLAAAMLAGLLLSACTDDPPDPDATPTPTASSTPTPTETTEPAEQTAGHSFIEEWVGLQNDMLNEKRPNTPYWPPWMCHVPRVGQASRTDLWGRRLDQGR